MRVGPSATSDGRSSPESPIDLRAINASGRSVSNDEFCLTGKGRGMGPAYPPGFAVPPSVASARAAPPKRATYWRFQRCDADARPLRRSFRSAAIHLRFAGIPSPASLIFVRGLGAPPSTGEHHKEVSPRTEAFTFLRLYFAARSRTGDNILIDLPVANGPTSRIRWWAGAFP